MLFAFENTTLVDDLVEYTSQALLDTWLATNAGPYSFRRTAGGYIYSASVKQSGGFSSFDPDNKIKLQNASLLITHFRPYENMIYLAPPDMDWVTNTDNFLLYKVVSDADATTTYFTSIPENYSTDLQYTAEFKLPHADLDPANEDVNLLVSSLIVLSANSELLYSTQTDDLKTTADADVNLDSTVLDDTIVIDGTVTSTEEAISAGAATLLASIESACMSLNVQTFQNLGRLDEYKALVDKAKEVEETTSLLSNALDTIQMDDVKGLATDIGDILQGLTYTMQTAVEIDDTALLVEINNFVSVFVTLQTNLEKFQLQISLTNQIMVPESLSLAVTALDHCYEKTVDVMAFMRDFVGLTPEATTPLDPLDTAMSVGRTNQIAEAMAALETIENMGDSILDNYENAAFETVRATASSIESETKESLQEVKDALALMTWLPS